MILIGLAVLVTGCYLDVENVIELIHLKLSIADAHRRPLFVAPKRSCE